MASSSSIVKQEVVTIQIEGLSTVHTAFADAEKKDLKRKLAACKQELAKTKNILLREQNGRACEGHEIVRYSDDGLEHLDNIRNKLRKGSNVWQSGMCLSKEEVGQLENSLVQAKNRFLDNKYAMVGTEDESNTSLNDEDNDEDDDEDDDVGEQR